MGETVTCPGCDEVYDPTTDLTLLLWLLRHDQHFQEA